MITIDIYIKWCIISTILFILSFVLLRVSYMKDTKERIKIKYWHISAVMMVIFLPAYNIVLGIFTFIFIIMSCFIGHYDNSFINKLKKFFNRKI